MKIIKQAITQRQNSNNSISITIPKQIAQLLDITPGVCMSFILDTQTQQLVLKKLNNQDNTKKQK